MRQCYNGTNLEKFIPLFSFSSHMLFLYQSRKGMRIHTWNKLNRVYNTNQTVTNNLTKPTAEHFCKHSS